MFCLSANAKESRCKKNKSEIYSLFLDYFVFCFPLTSFYKLCIWAQSRYPKAQLFSQKSPRQTCVAKITIHAHLCLENQNIHALFVAKSQHARTFCRKSHNILTVFVEKVTKYAHFCIQKKNIHLRQWGSPRFSSIIF